MRSAFGQTRSAIGQMHGQMRAHLTKFRSHLVTVGTIDQMRSAFGQMRSAFGQMRARNLPNVAHLVKCADWSNAPYSDIDITFMLADYKLQHKRLLI